MWKFDNSNDSLAEKANKIREELDDEIVEKARNKQLPIIPRRPEGKKPEWNPTVAICGECGREVKQEELYSCMKSNCPLKPVSYL